MRDARNPIECAFARLKARWSILSKIIDLQLENLPVVIYLCFVLHNYCEQNNIGIDKMLDDNQILLNRAHDNCLPLVPNNSESEVSVNSELNRLLMSIFMDNKHNYMFLK